MSFNMNSTIHTRLNPKEELENFLLDMGKLYNKVKHDLLRDYLSTDLPLVSFKNVYLIKYGISARHFNGIRVDLQGIISSRMELLGVHIKELQESIKSKESWIKAKLKKLKKESNPLKRSMIRFQIHHKKRKIKNLQEKLSKLLNDKETEKIRLCFGSKKLFKKQFNLQENGYSSHQEWREDWEQTRASNFFLLGSKDETSGNQNCQLGDDLSLKIRVPKTLRNKYGDYVQISEINFPYNSHLLMAALKQKCALNYRFISKEKGWYLHISFDYKKVVEFNKVSQKDIGAIGVDLNTREIAVSEIDRFGNLVESISHQTDVGDKSTHQIEAIYGDAIKTIVDLAVQKKKPIVIEKLDFRKKRATLKENGKKYSRKLSSFAYSAFAVAIKRRAYKMGIEVIEINPAYSSVIGLIKFMGRLGINSHQSAALVIARRSFRYSEKVPSVFTRGPLVKMAHRHVWSSWNLILKNIKKRQMKHHLFFNWQSLQDTTGHSSNLLDLKVGEILSRACYG